LPHRKCPLEIRVSFMTSTDFKLVITKFCADKLSGVISMEGFEML
jgi:hypothetical protein